MSEASKPHIRLMPDEIEAVESLAESKGIAFAMDVLGLDGLGNEFLRLKRLEEQLEAAQEKAKDRDYWYGQARNRAFRNAQARVKELEEQLQTAEGRVRELEASKTYLLEREKRLQEQLEVQADLLATFANRASEVKLALSASGVRPDLRDDLISLLARYDAHYEAASFPASEPDDLTALRERWDKARLDSASSPNNESRPEGRPS